MEAELVPEGTTPVAAFLTNATKTDSRINATSVTFAETAPGIPGFYDHGYICRILFVQYISFFLQFLHILYDISLWLDRNVKIIKNLEFLQYILFRILKGKIVKNQYFS